MHKYVFFRLLIPAYTFSRYFFYRYGFFEEESFYIVVKCLSKKSFRHTILDLNTKDNFHYCDDTISGAHPINRYFY